MKRKYLMFLVILSLFSCLFTSCGIPSAFGNISKYTTFSNQNLKIDNKVLPDGFDTHDIHPKVMFLYTIYSDNSVVSTSLQSVQNKMENSFLNDFKLLDYDYKGCPDFGNKPVTEITIKDPDDKEKEYKLGLYQLKTLETVKSPSSYSSMPTNFSSGYLFNKDNLEFKLDEMYMFTYELEQVDDTKDMTLIISCLDSSKNVVASYKMGNYGGSPFHTAYEDQNSNDYKYAKDKYTKIAILPVLYLESDVYSNRQMKVGSWYSLSFELPKLTEPPKTEKQ